MNICFISASVGCVSGSQETVIYKMARHLSEKHDVTVITGRSRAKPPLKRTLDAPFNVVTVPFWPRNTSLNNITSKLYRRLHPWKVESLTLYLGVKLRSSVKRKIKEADVILTYYRMDSKLFSKLAFKYGVPCVSNLQLAAYNKQFFDIDKSVMYLANSKFSKESLEEKFGITIEGFVTPGVSPEFFFKDHPIIEDIKDHKSLLFVGNLRRQKGVFELIDIFERIAKKHVDSKLFIIGLGDTKKAMEEKIELSGLTGRVSFLDEVEYMDIPQYYRSATLLIHPTHEETFGMVVLEAMACGLPVIASDIPALREVTGGTVELLPRNDLDAWVEHIHHLLTNKDAYEEWIGRGIHKAREHLWEKKAEQLERFLKKAATYKGKL